MKKEKKLYTAPKAELILLAPAEALAVETSADDNIAMNQWGQPVIQNASIVGGNTTYWGEDGTITQSGG